MSSSILSIASLTLNRCAKRFFLPRSRDWREVLSLIALARRRRWTDPRSIPPTPMLAVLLLLLRASKIRSNFNRRLKDEIANFVPRATAHTPARSLRRSASYYPSPSPFPLLVYLE